MSSQIGITERAAYQTNQLSQMGLFAVALRPPQSQTFTREPVNAGEWTSGAGTWGMSVFFDEKTLPSQKILTAPADFAPTEYLAERQMFRQVAARLEENAGFWPPQNVNDPLVKKTMALTERAMKEATFANSNAYGISSNKDRGKVEIRMIGTVLPGKNLPVSIVYDKGNSNYDTRAGKPTPERLIFAVEKEPGTQYLVIFHQLAGKFVTRIVERHIIKEDDYTKIEDIDVTKEKRDEVLSLL